VRAKMRQLGATAVPMYLSEVIPGLQQGIIDGTMSATAVYVNLKFNESGKVLTEVYDTMIISAGAVSRAWLAKLPADLRQAVIEEGNKLQPRINGHSRVLDEAMRKRWTEVGGEFVRLPQAEQGKLRQLLGGIGDEVTKDDAKAAPLYRQMRAVAEKN
jgi:TRAP-type transport system periplasmic protein